LNKWIGRIAKDVAQPHQTYSERAAVMEFVRSHRLSIAHAFHQRLVRGDVVLELTRLYRLEIASKVDVSPRDT